MANSWNQKTQKGNRQKGRDAKVVQSVPNGSSAKPDSPPSANAVSKLPPVETSLPISQPVRDEVVSKAFEAVDDLVARLCKDTIEKRSFVSNENAPPIQVEACPTDDPSEDQKETGNAWSQAVDFKLNELMERSKTLERDRIEIESLREHLKQSIESAELRLGSTGTTDGIKRMQELETQLIAAQQENTKISTLLLHTRAEYQSLLAFIESEAAEAEHSDAKLKTIAQNVLEKTDARETELSLEVSQLQDQLEFLQCELEEAKAITNSSNDSELRIQVEQLRSQLLDARHEAVELRMQNNDLGSRLAKFQGTGLGQKSETLTWEQRKAALLQQLEAETHAETPCDPRKILDIEKIIEQTNGEIERRNQEISDLKALIEQQSIAHDGMSIGVAAVAQMIESDSLVVEERLRLKHLRDEWEQKQRQAEIEMSMERAKLARERLELQERAQRHEEDNPPQTDAEKLAGKTRTRGNWLARLGLRDE